MDKEVDKKFKKVLKSNAMLCSVIWDATKIVAIATEAIALPNGAKQNALVRKIMKLTENIDNAYSSNWH